MFGKKRCVAILGCAGIISGILTIHPPLPRKFLLSVDIYVGAIFGIILAIYLFVFYRPRSITKAISVIVSSTIAYIAAMFSTVFADMFIPQFVNSGTRTGNTSPPSYVMFVGGTLGALIISTTVLLLYRDENKRMVYGILFCTLGGGILGVFGYSLGFLFGRPESNRANPPGIMPLYIIWQAGMGCLLAAFLPEPVWGSQTEPFSETYSLLGSDRPAQEKQARTVPLWGKLFIAVLTVSLVSDVAWSTWSRYDFRQQEEEFAQYQLAHPTLQNLEPVLPMSDENAVLLHPIAGRTAQFLSRLNNSERRIDNQPASVTFTVCYMRLDYRCGANPADVKVQVSQWPDSRWSEYKLEGIHYGSGAGYFTRPKRIQKFGNTIMADENPKYPGKGKFYWTSGAVLIVVDSEVQDSDEFIHEYLEQYPSSL